MSNHNNIVRIKAIAGLMDQLHEGVGLDERLRDAGFVNDTASGVI